jgi:hypothetical protein
MGVGPVGPGSRRRGGNGRLVAFSVAKQDSRRRRNQGPGRYTWNRDESELHITYQTADSQQRTFTAKLKDNQFLGPQGQVVGRVLPQGNVTIETDALPGRPANDNKPKLCPLPQPDKRTNDKGLAYEAFMRPRLNPTMPTPWVSATIL